jgi:hypothetical protein
MLQGRPAAFVATSNPGALMAALGPASNSVHVVLRTPVYERKKSVTILSNQPGLTHTSEFVFGFGALTFQVKDARLLAATEKEFRFAPSGRAPSVTVSHEGEAPLRLRLEFGSGKAQTRLLHPGEEWVVHASHGS